VDPVDHAATSSPNSRPQRPGCIRCPRWCRAAGARHRVSLIHPQFSSRMVATVERVRDVWIAALAASPECHCGGRRRIPRSMTWKRFRLGLLGADRLIMCFEQRGSPPPPRVAPVGPSRLRTPSPPWHRRLAAGRTACHFGPRALRSGRFGLSLWPLWWCGGSAVGGVASAAWHCGHDGLVRRTTTASPGFRRPFGTPPGGRRALGSGPCRSLPRHRPIGSSGPPTPVFGG